MPLLFHLVAQQVIQVGIQAALCHHPGVLALESPRRGIARIGKRLFANVLALFVEPVETCPRHEYLAAYLERVGVAQVRLQHQRDAAYGLHVGSDIIAVGAVAARQGLHQPAILVGQRNGQPVVFHLTAYLEVLTLKSTPYLTVPLLYVLLAVCVGKGEHGVAVAHLPELLGDVAAYAHRGRIGVVSLGVACLKVLQFVHQEVKFLVGDNGIVQHIIAMIMFMELTSQRMYSFGFSHWLQKNKCRKGTKKS